MIHRPYAKRVLASSIISVMVFCTRQENDIAYGLATEINPVWKMSDHQALAARSPTVTCFFSITFCFVYLLFVFPKTR